MLAQDWRPGGKIMKFWLLYYKAGRIFYYAIIIGAYILSFVSLVLSGDYFGFLKLLILIIIWAFLIWQIFIRWLEYKIERYVKR